MIDSSEQSIESSSGIPMYTRRRGTDRKERLNRAKMGELGYGGGTTKMSSSSHHHHAHQGGDMKKEQASAAASGGGGSNRRFSLRDFCIFLVACVFFVLLEVANPDGNGGDGGGGGGGWRSMFPNITDIPAKMFAKNKNGTATIQTMTSTSTSPETKADNSQQPGKEATAEDTQPEETPENNDNSEQRVQETPPAATETAETIEAEETTTTEATPKQAEEQEDDEPPPPPPPMPPMDPYWHKKVGWVVPMWHNCGPDQHEFLLEAAIVLRHSIHFRASSRSPTTSGSTYDYQMYALLLEGKGCPADELEALGYKVHQVDVPFNLETEITNPTLRVNLGKASGDGRDNRRMDQFIQLLAHTLVEEPIFVMLYINSVITRRIDFLFQAIQYPTNKNYGLASRDIITKYALERPTDKLPKEIYNFYVRDYPNTGFGRKPVIHRGGFWVARRNPALYQQALKLLKQPQIYVDGQDEASGWGGKGYTIYFAEGMTMAGFYAYLLDEFHSEVSVELGSCYFAHNGMDNRFRNPPRYHPSYVAAGHQGKCRSAVEDGGCGDCTTTPTNRLFHILYDKTCYAPWKCYGEGADGDNTGNQINTHTTKIEHCLEIQKAWHEIRSEIETKLALTDEGIERGKMGPYKTDYFMGHCYTHGSFLSMMKAASEETKQKIPELLWGTS